MSRKTKLKISLFLSVIAVAISTGSIGNMLSNIVDYYQLPDGMSGWMSTCLYMGSAVAVLIGIVLRNRIQKTIFISGGGMLVALCLFLAGIPMNFVAFLLICSILGIGVGITDATQSAYLADIETEKTSSALGLMHGIFGVGGLLIPLIIHALLKKFDWHTVYLFGGITAFILIGQFILVNFSKNINDDAEIKRTTSTIVERDDNRKVITESVKSPVFWTLLTGIFIGALAQTFMLVWSVRYVGAFLGNEDVAPLCLSFFWATSTVSRITVPRLKNPLMVLGIGSVISGIVWGICVLTRNPYAILLACTVNGFGSGCCIPLLLGEGASFNRNNTGFITNTLMMIKTCGQVLCPILVSSLLAANGIHIAMGSLTPLLVIDGIVVLVLFMMKKHSAFHK